MLEFETLVKRKWSRNKNINKIAIRSSCLDNTRLLLKKQLKSGDEVDAEDFVSVVQGVMKHRKTREVVLKVYKDNAVFARKELKIYDHLTKTGFKNMPKFYCDFTCLGTITDWYDKFPKNICSDKDEQFIFIIMEYIDGWTLDNCFGSPSHLISENQKRTTFLKLLQIVYDLAKKHDVIHGDLNSGYIIIRKHDLEPILIDYGRSYNNKYSSSSTVDDLAYVTHVVTFSWKSDVFIKLANDSYKYQKASQFLQAMINGLNRL
jgi:RIO-like serine/threonine protein kinase